MATEGFDGTAGPALLAGSAADLPEGTALASAAASKGWTASCSPEEAATAPRSLELPNATTAGPDPLGAEVRQPLPLLALPLRTTGRGDSLADEMDAVGKVISWKSVERPGEPKSTPATTPDPPAASPSSSRMSRRAADTAAAEGGREARSAAHSACRECSIERGGVWISAHRATSKGKPRTASA